MDHQPGAHAGAAMDDGDLDIAGALQLTQITLNGAA